MTKSKYAKYMIGALSPQELRELYVEQYAERFNSTVEHAAEMHDSEYAAGHDFYTVANVEHAIEDMARFCGI